MSAPSSSAPVAPAASGWRTQWSVAVWTGPSLSALAPPGDDRPSLTARDVTDVEAGAVADPFLMVVDGRWHLFVEVWNLAAGRGEIAHATSADEGRTWTYDAVVLREPFHLSYPHVFEAGGAIYMVPESRQDRAVRLYVAEAFPRGWRRVATLLEGPYADATPFHRDGRWWMFAQRGLDELGLFTSDALHAGWRPHPASPLWAGNRRRTRPGGRVLDADGRLLRFAQDAWPTYGHSLRAFEILELTPDRYEERELAGSPILRARRSGWNAAAMHHLDAVRRPDGTWLALVDGAVVVPA